MLILCGFGELVINDMLENLKFNIELSKTGYIMKLERQPRKIQDPVLGKKWNNSEKK